MENLENTNRSNESERENVSALPENASGDNVPAAEPGSAQTGKTAEDASDACTPIKETADAPAAPEPKKIKKVKKARKPVRVSLGVLIICILLTALMAFQATFVSLSLQYERNLNNAYGLFSDLKKFIQVAGLYDEEYLYDVDYDTLDEALTRMYILSSGDKYASYYTAEEWAASTSSSAGNSVGIGVYVVQSASGDIEVTHVMSDSPALKAGIMIGDIITAVDGHKVSEVGYTEAVNYVRGEVGTTVSIEILRDGSVKTIEVTRGTYTTETVISEVIEENGKKYGYVRIIEFMQITVSQFKNAVKALIDDGVDGFVFDVRDNPGGELAAICEILDFLLPEGPIAHIIGADGEERQVYTSNASEIDLPMTVLVNGNTASAAELFTSALRDYDKAEIVGTLTYGKGCGQEGFYLTDGSVVFITSFFYNPPFSDNYDGIGITPDIEVELPEELQNQNLFLIDHEEDTQLAAALGALKALS